MVELAGSVGIEALLGRHPAQLSHGERQRVAICRALITQPAIIMADEPTGNLDPENARAIMDIILGEVEQRGVTFLMATHDYRLLGDFDKVVDFRDFVGGRSE